MRTTIFILSCAGVLVVILSRPAGVALYRWHVETGGRDTGEWSFRVTLMTAGALLASLSFLIPLLPDQ